MDDDVVMGFLVRVGGVRVSGCRGVKPDETAWVAEMRDARWMESGRRRDAGENQWWHLFTNQSIHQSTIRNLGEFGGHRGTPAGQD